MRSILHKKLLPQSTSARLIITGLLIYILSEILKLFVPALDPLNPKWIPWLVKHIGDAGFILAIALTITSSTRSLRKNGLTLKRSFTLILGVGISLAFIAISIYGHVTFSSWGEILESDRQWNDKLADISHREELPSAERAKWSKLYAKNSYLVYGENIDYLSQNGEMIRYEPSQEDIEYRNERLKGMKVIALGKSMMLRSAFTWGAVLLVGLAIGLFYPISNNNINST